MRRRARLALGIVLAASGCACVVSCGGGSPSSTSGAGNATSSAASAPTRATWVLDYDAVWKTVSFALPRGASVSLPSGAVDVAITSYLATYRTTFGMADPVNEWRVASSATDAGFTTYRFQQVEAGLAVDGAEWVANVDGAGKLASFAGTYVPNLATTASLAAFARVAQSAGATEQAAATAAAVADVVQRLGVSAADVTSSVAGAPTIWTGPPGAAPVTPVAVFHVTTSVYGAGAADQSAYVVDAEHATILARTDAYASDLYAVTGSGYGAAHYAPYSQSVSPVSFPVTAQAAGADGGAGGGFLLAGASQSGVTVKTLAIGAGGAGEDITSPTQDPFTDSLMPAGSELDAQANLARVADAYHSVFSRNSYDNNGAPLFVFMGDPRPFAALWILPNASGPCTTGLFAVSVPVVLDNQTMLPGGASVDMLAHEFTHGISACSWGGGIPGSDSKSVDEGMSDVLGELVTGSASGTTPTTFGRDLSPTAGQYVRNLANPHDTAQLEGNAGLHCATEDEIPTCASLGGVTNEPHLAGTVVDYAWYLMTFGGTHITTGKKVLCPIGWEASKRLWFQTETQELHKLPGFRDLALATVSAGKKQDVNLSAVACAWNAVNVLTDADMATLNVNCATGNVGSGAADGGVATVADSGTAAANASGSSSSSTDGGITLVGNAGPLLTCQGGSLL